MPAPNRTLVLGPPGTGKTTHLLEEMDKRLQRGIPPSRIAFISFTRAAVREAKERACEKFGFVESELPFFRTLHSLCFYQLMMRNHDVFGDEHMLRLAELTGEELTGKVELEAPTLGDRGDALLFLDQYARNAEMTIRDAWHLHGTEVEWPRLKRFVEAYTNLRHAFDLHDFTDMLSRYANEGAPVDVDFVLVDEAQDLTPLQWRVVWRAFASAPELIVAGDDDQGIYAWAGASAKALLAFQGEKRILSQSYRLPRAIWQVAGSISGRIMERYEKPFSPHPTRIGEVDWLAHPEDADLTELNGKGELPKWLLLARTRRQLPGLATLAREQGVVYRMGGKSSVSPTHVEEIREYERYRGGDMSLPMWHDALTTIPVEEREYLLSCLRRDKRALTDPPRVRIETIHGAKGLEADRVLLLTDLNSRIEKGMENDPDAENRVLYVAVTRAKEKLHPVMAQGKAAAYDF